MSTYAIIGHGASPVGKKWGWKIDQCTFVVRMWDCQWQDVVDYGARYDYGLFEVHPYMMREFDFHRRRLPKLGWLGSVLGSVDDDKLPAKTTLIHQSQWTKMGLEMGGLGLTGRLQFTRGTIAACWAIDDANEKDEIILVGFDNVQLGKTLSVAEGFPKKYLSNQGSLNFKGYDEGQMKFGNHDYRIELPVMKGLAAKRKVSLLSAKDIWS